MVTRPEALAASSPRLRRLIAGLGYAGLAWVRWDRRREW